MKQKRRVIVFAVISVAAYIVMMLFHELGHAVTALFCGANITAFTFTHVDWGDAPFTDTQMALLFLNGTLLPLLVSVPFFCLPGKTISGAVCFGMIVGGWIELYAWTVESFLLHEKSDVTWFLIFSGAESSIIRILSVIVCLIYTAAACWRCGHILVNGFINPDKI